MLGQTQQEQARAAHGRGQAAYRRGDYRAAIAEFQNAYRLSEGLPQQPAVLAAIALSYKELGDWSNASRYAQMYLDSGHASPESVQDMRALLREAAAAPSAAPPKAEPTTALERVFKPTPSTIRKQPFGPTVPWGWIAGGTAALGLLGFGWWYYEKRYKPRQRRQRRAA